MSGASIRTNFILNLIGTLVRLAVTLVTVRIYIRHVRDARCSVISIASSLLFGGSCSLDLPQCRRLASLFRGDPANRPEASAISCAEPATAPR